MNRRSLFGLIAVTLWATPSFAASDRPVDLTERIKGAQRVVVAKAVKVTPEWRTNEHGDKLIVSQVSLEVEETFKAAATNALSLEVEGGTLDGLTLMVSSLPSLQAGDRAVFMLDAGSSGGHVPHQKGRGILKLDNGQRVGLELRGRLAGRRAAANAGR